MYALLVEGCEMSLRRDAYRDYTGKEVIAVKKFSIREVETLKTTAALYGGTCPAPRPGHGPLQ